MIDRKKKKWILAVCCTFITVCSVFYESAVRVKAEEAWPLGPEVQGEYAIVMELETGTVLYEKNAHTSLYPASITKILTALLALENSKMEDLVTFSYDSVHKTEGSGIWRDVDEVMTMEQCLYALMLNSANECAYAIAEQIGGSLEGFVQMMNDRAAALGCRDTHFNNPHGLTDEEHYTSCYDMALISREALKNNSFRQLVLTKRYEIPPTNKHPDEITYLKNHHKMLFEGEEYYYTSCIGGKTGYTEAAGHSLVTFAEQDGMTLICVVMKEENATVQYEDSIALLQDCFEKYRTLPIAENLDADLLVREPKNDFFRAGTFADIDKNAKVVLPKEVPFSDAQMEVVLDAQSPETAGVLQYSYGGRIVGQASVKRIGTNVPVFPFGLNQIGEAQEEDRADGKEPAKKQAEGEKPSKEPVSQQQETKAIDQENTEKGSEKKKFGVSPKIILWIVLGILVLAAVGFGIYKLGENYYFLRYKFQSRRGSNLRRDVLNRKQKRRWRR